MKAYNWSIFFLKMTCLQKKKKLGSKQNLRLFVVYPVLFPVSLEMDLVMGRQKFILGKDWDRAWFESEADFLYQSTVADFLYQSTVAG